VLYLGVVQHGESVMISSHTDNVRALLKHIQQMTIDDYMNLFVPRG